MFFAALLVMLLVLSLAPWWGLVVVSFFLGMFLPPARWRVYQQALAAGMIWAAWAFVRDGQSYGLISRRMSGAFQLPSSSLIFVVVFVLGFVTAVLCFQSGKSAASLLRIKIQ